jgi:serine/threonine protein phosphatase 1
MKKTFVIGDVHGEFDTLFKLIEKLPQESDLIFVGDIIDRGAKSKEVIEFIRTNNYKCVLGNHEQFMIDYGKVFLKEHPNSTNTSFMHTWYNNGGSETLFSYGLLKYYRKGGLECVDNEKGVKQFKEDIAWLETLPLYIELPNKINNMPVVISHANCANSWWQRNNPDSQESFKDYILWNRDTPNTDSEIFNIFGHTPVDFGPEIEDHYINIDTGCYIKKHGYNMLTAYCIETGDVIQVQRV